MSLLRSTPFLIPVAVMALCEIAKAFVEHRRTGLWHHKLFRPGGMPSSHSAFVTSLLIIVGRLRGAESVEFAIAFVFAAVVWYDALSVRREVGLQAQMLNKLQHWKHFTEQVGHSLREVLAGIVFGALITAAGIWLSTTTI